MTYSEKLRDPRWQRKRLEVFNRDNFSCTNCNSDKNNLQVHHVEYFSGIDPWEYPLDMLITLCYICHTKENKREKHESSLITSLKMNGFLAYDILHLSTKLYNDKSFSNSLKNILRK